MLHFLLLQFKIQALNSLFCQQISFINEILLKLPVKFLMKLKCVSKSWIGSISCPKFVKSHLNISANNKCYTHHRFMLGSNPPEYLEDCSVISLLYGHVVHDEITITLYKWTIDSDCHTNKSQNHSIKVVILPMGWFVLLLRTKTCFYGIHQLGSSGKYLVL